MTAVVGAAVPAVFRPSSSADISARRFSPNVAFYVSFHCSPSSSFSSSRLSALRTSRRLSRRSVETREGSSFVYCAIKEPARGYEQSKSWQSASGRNVRFTRAHVQEESSVSRSRIWSSLPEDGYKVTLRRPILEPPCHLADMRTNFMHNTTEALEDAHGRVSWRQPQVNARVSASLDSDEGKTDGARKSLEQMFQGRTNLGKKLEEEIKKRELGGSDGSGRGVGGGGGRRWGGGGGAGDDDMDEDFGGQDEPWDWEEVGQTFMATFALIILYFSITHGPKQVFRLFRLFFRWVRQGFTLRAIPWEYLEPGPDDVLTEDEEEEIAREFDEEKILSREVDDTPQQSNARDNYDGAEESEGEDFDLPAPPIQKKENRMAAMQAQQKEKMLQMLTKDRREKERRDKEDK